MEADLSTRLATALDRAEAEARAVAQGFAEALDDMVSVSGGHGRDAEFALDHGPIFVLRLVERDRAPLTDYASAQNLLGDAVSEGLSRTAKDLRAGRVVALCGEVERAVAFWLPEAPDA